LHQVANENHFAFEEFLYQIHGEQRIIIDIQEQSHGSQGASGSQVRYFNVKNTDPRGTVHQDRLVTKSASSWSGEYFICCRVRAVLFHQFLSQI
jgi:hypothetical protein